MRTETKAGLIVIALLLAIIIWLGLYGANHPWKFVCPKGMTYAAGAGVCMTGVVLPTVTRE